MVITREHAFGSRAWRTAVLAVTATALAGSLVGVPAAGTPAAASAPPGPDGLDTFSGSPSATVQPFLPDPEEQERRSLELDSSRTLLQRPDGSLAPRQPRLLRRTASLWMRSVGSPLPQQEVASLDLVQDVPGRKVVVTATFDEPPTAARNSALFAFFGTWDAEEETCTAKVQVAGYTVSGSSADAGAVHADNTSAGTATRSLSGSTLRLTWTGGSAGATGYTCVWARTHAFDGTTVADDPLEASYADDFDGSYEKAPEFEVHSSDLSPAYPGRWNNVYVSIRNEGDATASNFSVRGRGPKLKVRKPLSLGSIAPGRSKSGYLKVKLTGRATRALHLSVSAKGGWTATSRTKVGFKPRPTKVKSLAGRSYWGDEAVPLKGWTVRGLTFVNRTWVHVGIPQGGVPRCSRKVKACARYTYDARKGQVRIGKFRAKVDSEGLRATRRSKAIPKIRFEPLQRPRAGLRTAVKLSYYDYRGCESTWTCSTWWRHLTLRRNGTFRWTYEAIHSSGLPPNQTFVSISGPHLAGTYQFLKGARLRLRYQDPETGRTRTEVRTVGIDSDVLGRFGPGKGMLVGTEPHLP